MKTKRTTGVVFSLIVFAVFLTNVLTVKASTVYDVPVITGDSVKQSVRFSSYNTAGSAGGLSVSTVKNSLFVLKGGDGEHAVLHYYSNLYTQENHKIIKFNNHILGHANSMAIDGKYLYVTMWNENIDDKYKSSIIRISREAIARMSSNETYNKSYGVDDEFIIRDKLLNKETGKKEKIEVCRRIIPKSSKNGNPRYKSPILAMTRYKPNSSVDNKFLVWYHPKYDKDNKKLAFTTATVDNTKNRIIVSESDRDIFTVSLKDIKYRIVGNTNNNTYNFSFTNTQDIFYDSKYGLYIPLYNSGEGSSYIARINLKSYVNGTSNSFVPTYISKFVCNHRQFIYENHTINVSKYEIESLAFTKYSKAEINNANIGTRIVLSCNRSGQYNGEPVGGDSFDILKMNNTIGNLLDSF